MLGGSIRKIKFALIVHAASNTAAYANPTACSLLTAAEMGEVLGGQLTAEADDRGAQTKCTYSPREGFAPYAELQINWNDGKSGMAAASGMRGQLEDVTTTLAGLGDEATSVGPMILIRRGADLITLVLSGVDDTQGKAKLIYSIVDGRLTGPKSSGPAP